MVSATKAKASVKKNYMRTGGAVNTEDGTWFLDGVEPSKISASRATSCHLRKDAGRIQSW